MLQILGVLLAVAVTVLVVRKYNEKRGSHLEEPFDAPPSWEDEEDLRYGVEEEEDWSSDSEPWSRTDSTWRGDEDSGPDRPYIPELDDPDRR